MITLVMMACMLGNPGKCHEAHITLHEEGMGLYTCMMASQRIISQWANEKPGFNENFFIKRWRCTFENGKDI